MEPCSAAQTGAPVAAIILLATIVVCLGVGWWKSECADTRPAVPSTQAQTTRQPVPAAETKPALQKLKDNWLQPDGGYIIEVKAVEDSGTMDASYFNPQPTTVSKAEVSPDGATIEVFIELREENYPCSTHTLTYDPASDQLKGINYQAALQDFQSRAGWRSADPCRRWRACHAGTRDGHARQHDDRRVRQDCWRVACHRPAPEVQAALH